MIISSTPSTIKCQFDTNRTITFSGEWTLEPKFYVDAQSILYWDGVAPRKRLSEAEQKDAFNMLQMDAQAKGWVLEFVNL